jgi:hypothetical protein
MAGKGVFCESDWYGLMKHLPSWEDLLDQFFIFNAAGYVLSKLNYPTTPSIL